MFSESFRTIARQALRGHLNPQGLENLLEMDGLSLDEVDRLASSAVSTASAAVELIFETTASVEVATRLLTDETSSSMILKHQAIDDVAKFVFDRFGFGPSTNELTLLKRQFLRYVLVSEFLADMPGTPPERLLAVPHANTQEWVKLCRQLAIRLRDTSTSAEFYASEAQAIQEELQLTELGIGADEIGGIDTFPFEEQVLLNSLGGLIESGRKAEVLERIKARRQSFWTKVDPRRNAQWQVASTAIELILEAERVILEVKDVPLRCGELIERYADRRENRGWYKLDAIQRHSSCLSPAWKTNLR